ncbi:MAG: T9SS type A sorting domain-containing protein [candidate division Zixibacteria bacterium]|nr:T9SS type A sorting domain-containing protein [candidate division Zixibacteria bacterium]
MFNLNRGMFFTILVIAAALFISSISLAQFVSAKTISLNDALSEINISIVNDSTYACHGEGNAMFDASTQNIPGANFTLGEYDSYEISAGGDTTGYNPAVPTLCFNVCVPTTFIDQINAGIPLLDRIRLNSTLVPLENPTGKLVRPSQDFKGWASKDSTGVNYAPQMIEYGPARLADPAHYQQLNNFPEMSASVVHISVLRNIGIIGFEIPLAQYNGAEWFKLSNASLDIPIYDIQHVPPIDKKNLYHGNHNGYNTQDTCYITWMSERFPFFEEDIRHLFINSGDYNRYKQPIQLDIPPNLDNLYQSLWIIPDTTYQLYANELHEFLIKIGIPNMILTMDELQNTAPEWSRLQDKLKSLIFSMHWNSGLVDVTIVDGRLWDESPIYQHLFNGNTNQNPVPPPDNVRDIILANSVYYGDVTLPIALWDSDGDGNYGESTHDSWDIGAEVQVGNVPARTPYEFDIYIDNLKDYLLNGPGVSEFRARVFCHDQMTDYYDQENMVFDFLPRHKFADIDTISGVEPDGNANPTNGPTASNEMDHMSFWSDITFWTNLSHGNYDSWTACTDDYNHEDRSMVCSNIGDYNWWEDNWPGTGPGTITDLANTNYYSLLYTISCGGAIYDLEWQAMCSRLLFQQNGGTIANVGMSRYGWCLSSYVQCRIFWNELFNVNGGFLGCRAMNNSKLTPGYHSDDYNENWMGYAGLRIWTDIPEQFAIDCPTSMNGDTLWFDDVIITAAGHAPPSDVIVCVWKGSGEEFQWKYGVTTPDGHIVDLHENEFFFVPVYPNPAPQTYPVSIWVSAVHSADHNFLPLQHTFTHEIQPLPNPKAAVDPNLPERYALHPSYPNPFNNTAIIKFDLPEGCRVSIVVFNIVGQKVKTLVDDDMIAGYHQVSLDASRMSSGAYFYKIKAEKFTDIKKMVLLK